MAQKAPAILPAELKKICLRLEVAKNKLGAGTTKQRLDEAKKLFRGGTWQQTVSETDRISTGKAFSTYVRVEGYAFNRAPKFSAKARKLGAQSLIRPWTAVADALMERANRQMIQQAVLAFQDAWKYAVGGVHIGIQNKVYRYGNEEDQIHVLNNYPFVCHCPVGSGDFLWDPLTRQIDKSMWMAHRAVMNFETAKANSEFYFKPGWKPGVGDSDADTSSASPTDEQEQIERQLEQESPRVRLWMIWRTKSPPPQDPEQSPVEHVILAENVKDWAVFYDPEPHDGYPLDGLPYETLVFNEDTDDPIPISDLLSMRAQFFETDMIRTYMLEHIRRMLPRMFYEEGFATPEQLQNVKRAVDMALCEVDDISKMKDWTPPGVPGDFQSVEGYCEKDIQERSGVTPNMRGTPMDITATETQRIAAGAEVVLGRIADKTEDFMLRIMRKMMGLYRHYYDEEQWFNITGQEAPIRVTPDTLKADLDLKIEVGSMRPDADAVKKKQETDFYAVLSGNPLVDQEYLTKRYALMMGADEIDKLVPHKEEVTQGDENAILLASDIRFQQGLIPMPQMPQVQMQQNHQQHKEVIEAFIAGGHADLLSKEAKEILMHHRRIHIELMQPTSNLGGLTPGHRPETTRKGTPNQGNIESGVRKESHIPK